MEPSAQTEQKAFIKEVKKVCKQWKFDGVVLEMLSQIGKYVDKSVKFIQQFGEFAVPFTNNKGFANWSEIHKILLFSVRPWDSFSPILW